MQNKIKELQEEIVSLQQQNQRLEQQLIESRLMCNDMQLMMETENMIVFRTYFPTETELDVRHPEFFRRVLGFSREQMPSLSFEQFMKLVETEDREDFMKMISDIVNRKCSIYSGVFRMKHSDGSHVWLGGCVVSRGSDGITGRPLITGCIHDFGNYLKSHKQMNILNKHLLRLNSKKFKNEITMREKEIIELISQGMNYRYITSKMHFSRSAFNTIKRIIFGKVGANNSPHLINIMHETGNL